MKKGKLRRSIFIGMFVGIVVFLFEHITPNSSFITSVSISGLAALIGWIIANKLFHNNSYR